MCMYILDLLQRLTWRVWISNLDSESLGNFHDKYFAIMITDNENTQRIHIDKYR